MIEVLKLEFPAGSRDVPRRARVGVVSSGNLEILLEPSGQGQSVVTIRTSVGGFSEEWRALLERFFIRHDICAEIEINDSGASPPVVLLRLEQALEAAANDAR